MKSAYLFVVLVLLLASGAAACSDTDSRCEKWARKGQCGSAQKPWVLRKCPKSCDNCQSSPTWTYSGDLTTYGGVFTGGNCGFAETFGKGVTHFVAINNAQWNGGLECGRCVELICTQDVCPKPPKRVVAQISDRCPECPKGDLDLSPTVWNAATGWSPSRFHGRWRFIKCPDAYAKGNVRLLLKNGSNPWWFALQPLNFKVSVKSIIIYDANGTKYVLLAPGKPGNYTSSYYWQGSASQGLQFPIRIVVVARNGKKLVKNQNQLWAPGTSISLNGTF